MSSERTRVVLGVDIDGVLNRHRDHFCDLLRSLAGKELSPEAITTIPVHEIPGCGVTEADEHAVFNWPAYWVDMPIVEGSPPIISEIGLRNVAVWLFTRRPWPNVGTFPPGRAKVYSQAWREAGNIDGVTRRWLARQGIEYERLTIESALADDQTRFSIAEGGQLHCFVEDDLSNAVRLASSCRRVYLMDQPYNRVAAGTLASNIVRIRTWREIADGL